MTDNTVNVEYVAKANFRDLIRSTLEARAAQKSLNDEIARGNKNSVSSSAAAAAASRKQTQAIQDTAAATKAATRGQQDFEKGVTRAAAAVRRQNAALRDGTRAARDASTSARRVGVDAENAGKRAEIFGSKFEAALRKLLNIKSTENVVSGSLKKISDGFNKVSSAVSGPALLIAGLGALLSLINPLVAGVGALGAVALGAASSLGTLAGAAVGLVPALSAALAVAGALRVALGGVGGAISAGTKAASAAGTGGSSATKQDPYGLTAQEKVTRAQQAYRASIQDVHLAEQSLFDARRQYTRQVQDLTEAVNQYTDATKAADAASVESAQQNYDNVLASSASTKSDKDSALAAIQQAKDKAQQDALQHQRDVQDLAELKQGGVNNNPSVVQAQRGVTDAKNNVRDSQIAVQNAKYDQAHPASSSTGTAAKDTDAFAAAMAKLSPAAQAFVTWFLKFRNAWLQVQKAVQQSFFSQFVGDLNDAYRVLPSVQTALVIIAGALGKITDDLIKQVTGRAWQDDLVTFAKLVAPVLLIAGTGLQALLDAFRNLTLAGLPFLKQVVTWLADGAKHFAAFVDNGRKTGSIQKYLADVFSVMQQWWEIIKNVSATLFNYSTAAAPFGRWLTDGLVRLTGAWKTASEGALATNSPFKKWLENTKPVLTELKTVLGDFFTWIGQTASDKGNLTTITDLLKTLDKKIGPGVASILDSLVKAKVPQAFATLVGDLITLISDLMAHGGAQGIKSFFDTLDTFMKIGIAVANSGFGRWITETFLPMLGVLAAFALPLGPINLLLTLLKAITGFKPGPLIGKVAGWIGDLAGAVGRFIGPAFAGAATVIGDILGVLAVPVVLPKIDLPSTQKQSPFALTPSIDWKDAAKDASTGLIAWATGLPGLLSKASGDAFRDVKGPGHWLSTQWTTISKWASVLYRKVASAAGSVWRSLITVVGWLGTQWAKISSWAGGLARRVASAAGSVWKNITGPGSWLNTQWSTFSTWLSKIPGRVGAALKNLWSGLPSLSSWLNSAVSGLGAVGGAVASALGLGGGKGKSGFGAGGGGSFGTSSGKSTATGKWASTISTALRMAQLPQSWGEDVSIIIDHESGGNPRAINLTDSNAKAGHPSQGLMQTIPSTFAAYAGMLRGRGITDPLANIYAGINYIKARYGSPDNLKGVNSVKHGGAYSGYAGGGEVRGTANSDLVHAMLTSQEYVLNKKAVQRIGVNNLNNVNSGVMDARQAWMTTLQNNVMTMPGMTRAAAPTLAKGSATNTYVTTINNPKAEVAEESWARAMRRNSYLHKGR